MFTDAEIRQMRAIFDGAVNHDKKWKQIPASNGRLRAMATVVVRGSIQPHETITTFNNLTAEEKVRYTGFVEEIRTKEQRRG